MIRFICFFIFPELKLFIFSYVLSVYALKRFLRFLSFEEIITHHDVFVGSEATDYGEHLHNLHKFGDEL